VEGPGRTMTIRNNFNILLAEKEIRLKKGISVASVARETGITRKTLQGWAVDNVTRFDAGVLDALCNYFGCQVGDLLIYIPNHEPNAEMLKNAKS